MLAGDRNGRQPPDATLKKREDNMSDCVICKTVLESEGRGNDRYDYCCVRCGKFSLTGTARELVPIELGEDEYARSLLSHLVRKMQNTEHWPTLSSKSLKSLLETNGLPKPGEQANNLLLWLGENLPSAEELCSLNLGFIQSLIGAAKGKGVLYILQHLTNKNLIRFRQPEANTPVIHVGLTFEGWEEFERVKSTATESKIAFMAMQFNDLELDDMVKNVLRPAVEATGFELRLLSDDPRAGLIDDRMRVEIRKSKFVIADLTHRNPGAYWEAGFGEGLGKAVIYTCKKAEFNKVVHFDTNHHLTVMWDMADHAQASEDLKATIRATFPAEAKMND
jgi:nucleoside 2-deoxyribosyltransferase